MSRISRYQESIVKCIRSKSSYSNFIKEYGIDELVQLCDHEAAMVLLTILNSHCKKKHINGHHGYYMASGVDLLMIYVMINDNLEYYQKKFGLLQTNNVKQQAVTFVYECLLQNIETLEGTLPEVTSDTKKYFRQMTSYLHKKITEITEFKEFSPTSKVKRTDIIKFKFSDRNIIENKYKNLLLIENDILTEHIDRTYGAVCQCAFVFGWMLGMGEEKMIPNLEKLGLYFGTMIKIAKDFQNLERDINNSSCGYSLNIIVNNGIHNAFDLFDRCKVKLNEGCMLMGIHNITIKEVMDFVEKIFDTNLEKAELDLESKYSSFD